MEEPEAQSGGGGGRVRKKSQKLLEMEDFASAWKEQSTTTKFVPAGPGKAASPKKKCPGKTQPEATARLSNGKATAVVSATSDATATATAVADGSPKKDKERVSFAEKERLRKSDRDEYPDWKSDDGNIDGTPANPKIPNHAASKTSNASNDGRPNPSKPLVVTKTSSVHFSPTVRAGEVGSVEIVPKSEKNGSYMKTEIGSKRPAEGRIGVNGGETTPKKILKAAPPINGSVASLKTILSKGKPSVPSSSAHPTTPSRAPPASRAPPPTPPPASRAPPPTPPPASRAPPPTPPSLAKSKQNNFEEELLKADLALRKQKLAKKIKVTNDKSTATATATAPTRKIESLPTIIPSSSPSSASSSSTSSDILARSGVAEKKSVSFKVDKSPKSEKPKKDKKKSREELDHPTRDQQSHQSKKPAKSLKTDREPHYKPDADTEGYILFCKTARRKVKKDFPSISFSDITRVAVERWNALSPREKLIWSRKATKYSQSSAPKGKASSVSKNSSPSRKTKIGDISSASPHNVKRMGKQPQQQQQQRGSNSKQCKSIQQLQRIQQQNQRLKQKEQLQMSKQVELKPNVDARTSSDSVSISQTLPHAQPPQTPPPKLGPTTFVPPSDLDYSPLGHVQDALSVSSSSSSLPSTLDSAANLKLLGESLTVIGTRLTATTTPLAVQGGLSVLMDSLLCATAPLTALLTSEVPEIVDEETRKMQAQILENAAYIMPGM